MEPSVKITSFEAENVKRIKAVTIEPSQDGLTVIGGRNGQGKTSVLDAIAWALGGNKFKPSNPKREGSASDPYLRVELSNGIIVERKGTSSSLKITDPEGRKSGQMLLDSFLEQLALNLPKFLHANDKEKAETLLQIIGIGDELSKLDKQAETLYNQRTTIGQLERQKRSVAEDMQFYADAPDEPISAADLIKQQQEILARNGENQRKRDQVAVLDGRCKNLSVKVAQLREELSRVSAQINAAESEYAKAKDDLEIARKSASVLADESTAEIEASLAEIDATNTKVRTNQARAAAIAEADALKDQYEDLTQQLDQTRNERTSLLNGADLPLPGLSVNNGALVYNGQPWDCMSGSEQLKVGTAIVRRLNPACGFVLVDKLEQLDSQTLTDFGMWAQTEGLQVIGTRVSDDDECQIVIEDGYSQTPNSDRYTELTANIAAPTPTAVPDKKWSFD